MNTPGAAGYARDWLQIDPQSVAQRTLHQTFLTGKGCLLYVAFELQGEPKPPLDARVGRILSVGTDSHRRLQRGLERACLGQEVFFEVPEYRIHGFCDGILYIRPDHAGRDRPPASGLWNSRPLLREFDEIHAASMPKEEHIRQAQIYLWGLEVYFQGAIPLQGAIIYYENRDTLDHLAFEVYPDPEAWKSCLRR